MILKIYLPVKMAVLILQSLLMTHGVIGNTSDFGSEIPGSSPGGSAGKKKLTHGVIGNTSDSGSEDFRFES